jgi:hypothetical protein
MMGRRRVEEEDHGRIQEMIVDEVTRSWQRWRVRVV